MNEGSNAYFPLSVRKNRLCEVPEGSSTAETFGLTRTQTLPLKRVSKVELALKLNSYLYKKYSSSQNYYYIKDINDILTDSRGPSVICYKQLTSLDSPSSPSQITAFYPSSEYLSQMQGLVDYYRYHKEIPRMFAKQIYDLYFDHHDKKRKVEYVIITRNLNKDKEGKEGKRDKSALLKRNYNNLLASMPAYEMQQRCYHFQDANSRSLVSVYSKLQKLVENHSYISSFSNIDVSELQRDDSRIEDDENEINVGEKNRQVFNFSKKLTQTMSSAKNYQEAGLVHTPRNKRLVLQAKGSLQGIPREDSELNKQTLLSARTREMAGTRLGKELKLNIDEIHNNCYSLPETVRYLSQNDLEKEDLKKQPKKKKKKTVKKSCGDLEVKSKKKKTKEQGLTAFRSLDSRGKISRDTDLSTRTKSQHSKKHKKIQENKKSISFKFNWTKVNKMLTNPLLINREICRKSLDKGRKEPSSQAMSHLVSPPQKPYLDQKSKIIKGYHHKIKSSLSNQRVGFAGWDLRGKHSLGTKGEEKFIDLFSRKNSQVDPEQAQCIMSHRTLHQPSNPGPLSAHQQTRTMSSASNHLFGLSSLQKQSLPRPQPRERERDREKGSQKASLGRVPSQPIQPAPTHSKKNSLYGLNHKKKSKGPFKQHKYSKSEPEQVELDKLFFCN